MPDYPYDNVATQKEKRAVLENDRKVKATYMSHAEASIDELAGGRYGAMGKPTVVGTSAISYPAQPGDAPSNQATLVGKEPSLGYDINAIEPIGEPHEQVKAAQVLASRRLRRL